MGHIADLVQLDPRVAQVQGFCKGSRPLFASLTPFGGAEEIRTPDPLRAKEVLSQLSYGPALLPASEARGQASLPSGLQLPAFWDGGPLWIRTRDLSLIRTAL
jgi:hypothetical protein